MDSSNKITGIQKELFFMLSFRDPKSTLKTAISHRMQDEQDLA